MSKNQKGRIEILEGFPNDVVAVEFTGRVDGDQFENQLKPVVADRIKMEGKVKLFYILGKDFAKASAGFVWGDANFAVRHMHQVARIAVVTDKKWLRKSAHFFARLIQPEVRVFKLKNQDVAKQWIMENTPPMHADTNAEDRMAEAQKTILPIEQ